MNMILKKLTFFIFNILLLIFLTNCDQEDFPVENSTFSLLKINNNNIISGDTIELYGKFPKNYETTQIIIDKKNENDEILHLILPKDSILDYTTNKIKFVFPYDYLGDKIYLLINTLNINNENIKDTTQKLDIKVNNIFDFDKLTIQTNTFILGSEFGLDDELPQNIINFKHKLEVSILEINQRSFYSVMRYNNSSTKKLNLPVDSISWIEAILFCNKLSDLKGLDLCYNIIDTNKNIVEFDENKNGWRLPTEAEWEYLAKGNTNNDFFQNKEPNELGWYVSNSGIKLLSGKQKLPNLFNLFDIHGNVWEWCWDYYNSDYFKNIENISYPKGPTNGQRKVKRGGSFRTGSIFLRASNRKIDDNNLFGTGIRLVRTIK